MVRRIAVISVALWSFAVPVGAQHVEASISGGYTLSEGIETDNRDLLGQIYNKVEVNSGGSVTATFGVYATPRLMFEFLYSRQSSGLTAEGAAGKLEISDLSVENFHGNIVYHFGDAEARIRPFAFGGLGATNYSFGDLQLPGGSGPKIPGNTQFSTTWGAGVKLYLARIVGARFTARWTPTYIKSDAGGYWCDPFYGCWIVPDVDYSNQFDLSGGLTFRF
jgi:hypothetical protein